VLGDVVDACRDIRGAIHAGADDVVKDKAGIRVPHAWGRVSDDRPGRRHDAVRRDRARRIWHILLHFLAGSLNP